MEKETWIILGLGNPDGKYLHTRHNVGFDVTDRLLRRLGAPLLRERLGGRLSELTLDGRRLVIAQPLTYMNLSGECAAQLLAWYKCPANHMLVICDDIDLKPGQLRLRARGSAGTHNGLRSLIQHIPDGSFPRLRVGVGAPPAQIDLVNWVLGHPLTTEEAEAMAAALDRAADAALDWFEHGSEHAMSRFNGGGKPKAAAPQAQEPASAPAAAGDQT